MDNIALSLAALWGESLGGTLLNHPYTLIDKCYHTGNYTQYKLLFISETTQIMQTTKKQISLDKLDKIWKILHVWFLPGSISLSLVSIDW